MAKETINNGITLPVYDREKCILFALGRNAMYAAGTKMGLGGDDEILTPAFDCDGSLQPFRALGCKLNFFRSDPYTFEADIDDIRKKITPRTRLLHVINHFGFSQPWDELMDLRKETTIPIMEDNAYSLFSKYKDRMLGTFGDVAIFSLRKNLMVIDGGMLRVNNPEFMPDMLERKRKLFYSSELNGVATFVKRKMGWYKMPGWIRGLAGKINKSCFPPPPLYSEKEKGYPDWPLRDFIGAEFSRDYTRPMSMFAYNQLKGFSGDYYNEAIDKKRKYYSFLSERLNDIKGIKILNPALSQGAVPFCVSLLINKGRDHLLGFLQEKYDVMAWPTLSGTVIDRISEFDEVELLGRKILQINLAVDKFIRSDFGSYADRLIKDISALAGKAGI